jgi:hypothetical protein
MKITKFKNINILSVALAFCLLTPNVEANEFGLTDQKYQEIENRVNSMSLEQLTTRRSMLLDEQEQINSSSGSASRSGRLKEIAAELSAIQKALVAIAGLGAISALTDDGYNDNVPPVITILGDNPATVELGATYTDAGATAFDEFHGETPVSSSGTVDTAVVGSYTITYTATDKDNNTATATRTVNVVDTTAPVVTVTGDNPATHELGTTYTDAGATATDLSGDVDVVTTGTVDTTTVGTYTLTYTATDPSGNEGTATRTVNVTDTTAPVFTSSATFIVDENQTDIGTVTATDADTVTFTISNTDAMTITAAGVLTFITAIDYEDRPGLAGSYTYEGDLVEGKAGYDGSTYDFTATVTATDASENATTQDITVKVRDVGGVDDIQKTETK